MGRFYSDPDLARMAEEFNRLGYLRIEAALTPEQVDRFDKAVDRHLEAFPEDWITLSDSFSEGTISYRTPPTSTRRSRTPRPSKSFAILGNGITFEEFAIMLRNPTANLSEVKGWHRDLVREYDRRKEIDAVSIMMYLTDVTETDHCFAIIPESHERLIDLNPLDVPPPPAWT